MPLLVVLIAIYVPIGAATAVATRRLWAGIDGVRLEPLSALGWFRYLMFPRVVDIPAPKEILARLVRHQTDPALEQVRRRALALWIASAAVFGMIVWVGLNT